MAAASAGAIKPGVVPVNAAVNCIPHVNHQQLKQQSTVHQQSHTQLLPPSVPQHLIQKLPQQRISYVQRTNEPQRNTGTIVSIPYSSTSSSTSTASHTQNHHHLHQQQLQQQTNQQNYHYVTTKGPNVSKGWRRLIIKGDIVYVR